MKNLIIVLVLLAFLGCEKQHLTVQMDNDYFTGMYILDSDTIYFTKTLCIFEDSIHYRASQGVAVFDDIVFFRNLHLKYEDQDSVLIFTDILNTETKLLIKQ